MSGSSTGRRPPFREQTLSAILLRMALAVLSPRQRPVRGTAVERIADEAPAASVTGAPRVSTMLLVSLGALALVAIVSVVVLVQIFSSSSTPAAPAGLLVATPAGQPSIPNIGAATSPLVVPPGTPLTVLRTYGGSASQPSFLQPEEAVRGANGMLYVADTGNHRVAMLDRTGKPAGSITSGPGGPLIAPFSLAITPEGHLLVLDSELGQVIEYDVSKGAPAAIVRSSDRVLSLVHARGIARDAAGDVFVADPASNSVTELHSDLTLLHQQPNKGVDGTDLFDQPSAVGVDAEGTIYVVDSQNGRLVQLSSGWRLLHSWPLAIPDTLHSPRILPVSGGRVLVSDPRDSKLLLYSPLSDQPAAYTLPATNGLAPGPLGLARDVHNVLVTCNVTNQVAEVAIPGL